MKKKKKNRKILYWGYDHLLVELKLRKVLKALFTDHCMDKIEFMRIFIKKEENALLSGHFMEKFQLALRAHMILYI